MTFDGGGLYPAVDYGSDISIASHDSKVLVILIYVRTSLFYVF